MKTSWTIAHLDKLLADGKIKGYCLPVSKHAGKGKAPAKIKKTHPAKEWMTSELLAWCQSREVVLLEEHKFHPTRKFRFDWAIPDLMVAIEYEGLIGEKSRHTTITGYTKDTEKYNAAAALGWRVLRFTALNYKEMLTQLNDLWTSTGK